MPSNDDTPTDGSERDSGSMFWLRRRGFMKQSTAALVVAAAGPAMLFAGTDASAADDTFSQNYFAGNVGNWFQVDAGSPWTALELIEVEGMEVSPEVDQFSVMFRGSPNTDIAEGLYVVVPPSGASFELHIQPVGSDETGDLYSASFCLMRPVVPSCAG